MTLTWLWQTPVLAALLLIQGGYWQGRRTLLRQQAGVRPGHLAKGSALLFMVSQTALAIALISPLHEWASQIFPLHVAQHLLVAAVTPAFFWFSDPLPIIKAGLPAALRHWVSQHMAPDTPLWTFVKKITPKGFVWLLFVCIVWFWYDQIVHVATLSRPWLHLIELATVFLAANLYWWHIAVAAPRIHKPLPSFAHMLFALGGAWPIKAVGAAAIFTERVFYDYPADLLALWNISPIDNQLWGGILIWGFGGVAFTTSSMFFLRRWLGTESAKPVRKLDEILTDEKMLAPGIKQ